MKKRLTAIALSAALAIVGVAAPAQAIESSTTCKPTAMGVWWAQTGTVCVTIRYADLGEKVRPHRIIVTFPAWSSPNQKVDIDNVFIGSHNYQVGTIRNGENVRLPGTHYATKDRSAVVQGEVDGNLVFNYPVDATVWMR